MIRTKLQFVYEFRHLDRFGSVVSKDRFCNLIPKVGRDYMMDALFGSGTKLPGFFIGLIGAAGYVPAFTDTPAYLAANASEITNYGAVRPAFNAAVVEDSWSNSAAPATLTFTAQTTVYGGFLQSNNAFNSATGVLLSTAKASSPRVFDAGESLQVVTALIMQV